MSKIPTDGNLVSPMGDFSTAVSLGVLGGYRNFSTWCEVSTIGTVFEELSNVSGIRDLPVVSGEIQVESSSNADNGATATGILVLRIEYLDSDFEINTYDVTLNGTTPVVSTGLDAYRIRSVQAISVGSNGFAEGDITISIGADPQAMVMEGYNESTEVGFTVPANTKFISTNAVIATGRSGNVDVNLRFQFRYAGSNIWYTVRQLQNYQEVTVFDIIGVAFLPPGTDVRVLVAAGGGSGPSCYVQLRGYDVHIPTQGSH